MKTVNQKTIDQNIQQEIQELFSAVGVGFDSMDLGCTLFVAMNETQRADLMAMMQFLEENGNEQDDIAYNVLHDLNGLKAIYLNDPHGKCFLPRSSGYAAKV